MNKNYRDSLVIAALLFFSACSRVPTSRVHGAASVPRFVDVNNYSFSGENPDPERGPVGGSAGVGYGLAWADSGNAHGSQVYHLGVNFRTPRIAFGWTPFLGLAQVSHEGTGVFGSMLWIAFHMGGGDNWRFSYQNSYASANKTNEETGCVQGNVTVFGDSCISKATISSRVEVKVKDVGFIITGEKNLHGGDSIVIAPGAYWTSISAGSKFDADPAGDYNRRTSFWSPGLQVGYVSRFGEKKISTLVVMVGGQWVKTFVPGRNERELLPTADLRFQF